MSSVIRRRGVAQASLRGLHIYPRSNQRSSCQRSKIVESEIRQFGPFAGRQPSATAPVRIVKRSTVSADEHQGITIGRGESPNGEHLGEVVHQPGRAGEGSTPPASASQQTGDHGMRAEVRQHRHPVPMTTRRGHCGCSRLNQQGLRQGRRAPLHNPVRLSPRRQA